MRGLLLDEQISPVVAAQVRTKRPDIPIQSVHEWRGGRLLGTADRGVLAAAAEDGLTLVTYDRKTIPPLVGEWSASGRSHGGVVYVDTRTIASSDFGRLVRALTRFWDRERTADWTNRIGYLPASR